MSLAATEQIIAKRHIPYEHAFSLCEQMLTAIGIGIAAVWAHVVWLNHQWAKRMDRVTDVLAKWGMGGRSAD